MSDHIVSKALEVNLENTRDLSIQIPEDQAWLLSLSESKWGTHKRTQDFLTELNHKFRNNQYVIESLHSICLTELWFYNGLDDAERALDVFLSIFKELMETDLPEAQRDLLIKTFIKFMDRLTALEDYPEGIIRKSLDLLDEDSKKHEVLYVSNTGYFKTYLARVGALPTFAPELVRITKRLLKRCYDDWEKETDILTWYRAKSAYFQSLTEEDLRPVCVWFYTQLKKDLAEADDWKSLTELMFFNDMSNYYRSFTEKLPSHLDSIYYLFYLLRLDGMRHLSDHLLYDMNRNLRSVFKELGDDDVIAFIDVIMAEFKSLSVNHSGIVLDCILTLGKEVIDIGREDHISYFVTRLIALGFQYPGKMELNDDWQIKINTSHVKNIRVWLELIEHAPLTMRNLLAALIVNLKLGGIFISDTDLFQRDVTKLLNADIAPVYREIKQLARIFPVYFRDIGAEGRLREVTTSIDEASLRKDRLIHFLRKQVHTESNNTHIELTRKILFYWYTGDKAPLEAVVPKDVFDHIGEDRTWFEGVHAIVKALCDQSGQNLDQCIEAWEDARETVLNSTEGNERDRKRVAELFEIHALLLEKYSLESDDIVSFLNGYHFFTGEELEALRGFLETGQHKAALEKIYAFMSKLKGIILNPEVSEALEQIYYKRHVAVGIPSMYGQYIENKFEALGLMYRLERTAVRLMMQLVEAINLDYVSARTIRYIYEVLTAFQKGLELDGISNQGFDSHLDMLKYAMSSPSFSFEQYVNLFEFMAKDINRIMDEYFISVFEGPLEAIIPQLPDSDARSDGSIEEKQRFFKISERFFREHLAAAFLVQDLDRLITRIHEALVKVKSEYSSESIESMMTYDPDLAFSALNRQTPPIDNPVFLGAKAYFLKKLMDYGFNVPPGFILTTEVFRHKDILRKHPLMMQELNNHIKDEIARIEMQTGTRYGDPDNPLFFSVRSGSSLSLPGAMKTFLNVGMNDEIAERFSEKPGMAWTAWDSYRRFLQSWGMAFGVDRDIFDRSMLHYKNTFSVDTKIQFTPDQMRAIAMDYKAILKQHGLTFEEDLFKQMKQAIASVVDSWFSKSADEYRKHMQIAGGWGTAVLVQKMILGNRSSRSGTGVVFTSSPFVKNPSAGITLYGDFVLCSQGEDVVSGLVHTLPITEKQRKSHYKESPLSLESGFPEIYEQLKRDAKLLIETYGFAHQDIEFTFESDAPEDLYILQIRNQNLKNQKTQSRFETPPPPETLVGKGIGISPEILSGLLAFDLEDMASIREKYPDKKIVLARPDTVPDDIPLVFQCDGLITARGGATSHAAVTAASLGKVCIVGCSGLSVDELKKECRVGGKVLKVGDALTLDGEKGQIFSGAYKTIESPYEVMGEGDHES
ncbi:MAG: pyruvate, orthophosphate dikinase [Clostridiales bacterium]|nr:pyruvate, orthophosphate dikinase [Clostridiales bacterium]